MNEPLLAYILSQTRQNIEFLVSQGAISALVGDEILKNLQLTNSEDVNPEPTARLEDSGHRRVEEEKGDFSTTTEKHGEAPLSPPHPSIFKVKALWAYNEHKTEANDLSSQAGDVIEVTAETNPDWWAGRCNGQEGLFPSSYVERLVVTPPHRPIVPGNPSIPPYLVGQGPQFPTAPPYPNPAQYGQIPGPLPPSQMQPYSQNYQYQAGPVSGPPPSASNQVPPQEQQVPPKKHKLGGKFGSTLAHSAVGGVGFGAGKYLDELSTLSPIFD